MYTLYDNLRFTGHDQVHTWQQGTHCWAAYSVYSQKANHEVYTPNTILNLIIRGEKRMYDGRIVHHLQAGDVFIIPAGSLICSEILATNDGFASINLELPEALIASCTLTRSAFPDLHIGALKLDAGGAWRSFAEELLQQFMPAAGPPASPSQISVAMRALSLIMQAPGGTAIIGMLQQAISDTLPEVMHTLGRELPHLNQLDEVARSTCMSKATLKRRFRQLYHSAPMHWVWEKRLGKAAFLLRTTPAPIADVAYSTGFENISHFYRLFRKSFGITPKDWRTHAISI
jgi:AraC-like DNA-binding protein